MPPFTNPAAGPASKKRKSEGGHDEQPYKRSANDGAWSGSVGGQRSYWMCQYRAPQYRKHKTWDGDGVLEVLGTRSILYDLDSKKYASVRGRGRGRGLTVVPGLQKERSRSRTGWPRACR